MRTVRAFVAIALGCVLASPAPAELLDLTAQVESLVEQVPVGAETPRDYEFESFPQTSNQLRLATFATLQTLADGDDVSAAAEAVAVFNDPRLTNSPQPRDFSLEAAAFSDDPRVGYQTLAQASETRTVNLTPAEIGLPVGSSFTAQSEFALDAVLLMWNQQAGTSLDGLQVNMSFTVRIQRPGLPEQIAHSGEIILTGNADGTATVTTAGALQPTDAIQVDLTDQVDQFARTTMLLLPRLVLPYEYAAVVGETFQITGTIEVRANAVPGGTGTMAFIGQTPEALADVVNSVLGSEAGDELADLVTVSIEVPETVEGVTPGAPTLITPTCALLGVESIVTALGLAGLAAVGSTRQRRRP